MAVTIDTKSIRAQLRQFGDGMLLMARSMPALSPQVMRAAAAAAEAEETTPFMGSVTVIPAGVVMLLEGLPNEVIGFVEKLAAELDSRTDAQVKLCAAPGQATPQWMVGHEPGHDSITAWMVHHISDQVLQPWAVDAATTRRLAAAVGEELELPDANWVWLGSQLSLNYAGVSVADAAPDLVRANMDVQFECGRREPLAVGHGRFLGPGIVTTMLGRPTDTWLALVEATRRLLMAAPEACVYGATLTGRVHTSPNRLPLVGESDYMLWSQYWDRIVPDAYGIQVLGPKHIGRIGDLLGWVTTRLEGGRYLVEARDLVPWFEGRLPDPEVLAAARDDFAGLILTAEYMEENPISERARVRAATATSRGTLSGGDG